LEQNAILVRDLIGRANENAAGSIDDMGFDARRNQARGFDHGVVADNRL
jgi:hypothetical protein